jgi:DNA segregation ATPase FtsK/SpoIIIE, S-DNA-T family
MWTRRQPRPGPALQVVEAGRVMPTLIAETEHGDVPVGPVLSMFDPVFIGIDEFGHPLYVPMIERNMLIGGEPGSGKSSLLNLIVAHAALSPDTSLVLLDGKQVELGQWREVC